MRLLLSSAIIFCLGCTTLTVDTSPSAAIMNDKTLVHSCDRTPGNGVDVCRFTEGAPISSTWNIFLPVNEDSIESVSVRIRFRDKLLTRTVKHRELVIDWKDVLGHDTWQKEDDGPVQAVIQVKYTVNGETRFIDLLGYAYLIILRPGYTPLDVREDVEFTYSCLLKYSTAGRSALECQP